MKIDTASISLMTRGEADVHDITRQIEESIQKSEINDGIVTVFCPSATSAVTTIEYEPGCVSDLRRLFDDLIPREQDYAHNLRWGDGNGYSHIRAALLKPSLTIPLVKGKMTLGTWQEIIYVDFDNRPRQRDLVIQIMGE